LYFLLEGTFGFQLGEEMVEGSAGAFMFVPKGTVHAFWNQGTSPARMLVTMSPPGFWRYLEELAEGLAAAGDDAEAAMALRKELSEKYDVEIVGPPRRLPAERSTFLRVRNMFRPALGKAEDKSEPLPP
jgi:hypothetical protein